MDKFKKTDREKRTYRLNNKRMGNTILLLSFITILFFISLIAFEGNKLNISIGDYSETDIRASKDIVDVIGTEKLRQEAFDRVQPRYRISPSVQIGMKDTISDLLDTVRDYKAQNNISNTRKAEEIQESLDFEIANEDIINMLRMDYQGLSTFETTLIDLINQIMGRGIREEDLEYEKANLDTTFEALNLSDTQKSVGLVLMSQTMKANNFVDESETKRIRDIAVANVEEVIVQENEIIALEGELINEQSYELIKESGLLKDSDDSDLDAKLGILVLILLSVATLVAYIYHFNKEILDDNRSLVLFIVMLLTILMSKGIYGITPYLIPVAAGGLLIALLINSSLGIMVNMFLSLFLGFILGLDLSFITMLVVGGTIAILAIAYQRQRSNILVSGIILAFANVLIITSFGFIRGIKGSDILIRDLYVFLNGIITIIITIGSLPLWEHLFSILTPIKLLELSNPNQALLKRLLVEAPGTYHHSLMVGNLSEAGADAIGANSLLVRVGSYYHDIGKLYKPYYFAENQFSMSNPHDLLEPHESARIILAHVTEGLKMAKDNKLPSEIIEFIDQHHGTTTVAYFYYKAKEKDPSVDIEDFRYKGKKPQSKETALVMLGDSVEAAVRSIKEPTKDNIEDMVKKVIRGKINDGQLDECDITNKDINTVTNTFISILMGIYHDRIEYPSEETSLEESK